MIHTNSVPTTGTTVSDTETNSTAAETTIFPAQLDLKQVAACAPVYALGTDVSLYKQGDVNMDGAIDFKDAIAVLTNYNLCDLTMADPALNDAQLMLANVGDRPNENAVNSYDASLIMYYYAATVAEIEGIENMTVAEFWAYKQAKGIDLPEADLSRGQYVDRSHLDYGPGGWVFGIVDGYDEYSRPIYRKDEHGDAILVEKAIYHPETDDYEYIYLKRAPVYELEIYYYSVSAKSTVHCLAITDYGDLIYRDPKGAYCCRKASDWFDYIDGEWVEKQ